MALDRGRLRQRVFNANFDIVTYLQRMYNDGFIRRFWENDKYKIRFGNRFCDVLNSNFRESHILEEMDKGKPSIPGYPTAH